jgi:hypothetical protein
VSGQSEVGDPGLAVLAEQDVVRLEVAVDDAVRVGMMDGPGQRLDQPGRFLLGPRPSVSLPARLPPPASSIEKKGRLGCGAR